MTDRLLTKVFLALYCCALIALGVATTPPADPHELVGDLPPMTVGYGEGAAPSDGTLGE